MKELLCKSSESLLHSYSEAQCNIFRQGTILKLSSLCPAINGQTSSGIFIEDCFISTTFQYIFSISWSSSVIMRKKAIIPEGDSSCNEEDENIKAILTMKARLKSSAERIDSYRGMIKGIVSQGLNRMTVESMWMTVWILNGLRRWINWGLQGPWLWMIFSIN
ncbi:hypothetical protein QJS04_geneDACA008711 [Acorus gramineus]|uniref:Uncharacterized protein n=1 Tax=Acorus gramineus TaxID=55184 RepID=A0AAV9ACF1_ACOGR|nr:hypothetical protein QJS04_geneDACA008711 [Acorus gramineus]